MYAVLLRSLLEIDFTYVDMGRSLWFHFYDKVHIQWDQLWTSFYWPQVIKVNLKHHRFLIWLYKEEGGKNLKSLLMYSYCLKGFKKISFFSFFFGREKTSYATDWILISRHNLILWHGLMMLMALHWTISNITL